MSIEAILKDLTEAIRENTAAHAGGSTSAAKTSTGKAASGAKGKAASSKKKEDEGITVDKLAERFGKYLATGSAADKKEAKANVKKIVDHFEVSRVSEIDPENFEEAMGMLDKIEAGEDPFDEDVDGDEDGDLM